ncbi:hypothetical protein ATKI12_1202 [Kitasatospora sp. Ki12]|uniref:hypothetical protein n=1 Tax=Kitasatospora xanthocidica TaxID=83382 RepID=UPI00167B1226|nr:hypothetical protein [Kitasatospora xanthocidica]
MKATKTLRRTALGTTAGLLALAGTMVSAGTAHADAPEDLPRASMSEPGVLYQGQYIETGYTRLILQTDGNLVVYRTPVGAPSYAKWIAPRTWGCGQKAIMQGDGNFVVYGAGDRVCWASNTFKSNKFQHASLVVWGYGGVAVNITDGFESGGSSNWNTLNSSDLY